MQKKTIVFAVAIVCLLVAAGIGLYMYQKPRASLVNLKPEYTLSAHDLYIAFEQNEQKANKQFIEKVIQVKGTVDNIQGSDTVLNILLASGNEMGGINCAIPRSKDQGKFAAIKKGSVVELKGKCVGFLMDVNLVDAVLVKGE